MKLKLQKLLIANRGEIAIRVIRAAKELGIKSVAVYSEADENSAHRREADEGLCIGPAESTQSYLNIERILQAAKDSQADAIHPGYGFLSEREEFASAVERAGLVFVGPKSQHIRQMGDKVLARETVAKLGLPTVPGTGAITDIKKGLEEVEQLLQNRSDFRFPLLVKAAGGGGGKGMRRVQKREELKSALERAQSESSKAFNNPTLFVERLIQKPRHIEVQVFGDGTHALHFFERECSLQRRHQKVMEEALSPSISSEARAKMTELSRKATEAMGYQSAGTFEFIVSPEEDFYFLEMNTRIQVEHPVTEWISQVDLVREQLRVASGEPLSVQQSDIVPKGHSIELRLYAEDAEQDFIPQPGFLRRIEFPHWNGLRVDAALMSAGEVSSFYDPMIAKLSVWGVNRSQAIARARLALQQTKLQGCVTNRAFLLAILESEAFVQAKVNTEFLESPGWRKSKALSDDAIAAICLKDFLERGAQLRDETLSSWQQTEMGELR
ncbi:MAG: ATP-grasp domain-containing protein [Bradymonadales bacterium]|nr:MAG: ATP-grasp domain-containing protein [Bradymonadales bacterium]